MLASEEMRAALQGDDRENFIKAQIIACQKVLNKAEAPLKQKHVRALIVGTHKERSATLFWSTVSRIQLEKSPVITWKFCNLLHKLIRDGHRRVPDDCARHISRLVQLGNFWQHLRASGYGHADAMYCRLLTKRLQFHQKYTAIPGSLSINDSQIDTLTSDVNSGFELAIDLLDQLDELIAFKTAVLSLVDSFRWTSMIPQCQCLLAPLILVILDTSLLYDVLVKVLFKLHSSLDPEVMIGHRERFYALFKKIKEFYESASNLQYFRYLVSVPVLPASAPNFLQSSERGAYRTQHAYLREDAASDGADTPPDAQSLHEDILIDLSMPEEHTNATTSSGFDNEQANLLEKTAELRRALENEMKAKDEILTEARTRIDQYEQRLVDLKTESDQWRLEAESTQSQLRQLKEATTANEQQAEIQRQAEEKAAETERRFQKLQSAYNTFRGEHLEMLYELRDLRNFKAEHATESDELRGQLEAAKRDASSQKKSLESICDAAEKMFVQCREDLQNSSTISYPTHLADAAVKLAQNALEQLTAAAASGSASEPTLLNSAVMFAHDFAEAMVPCAAAAYTASIEHYEPVLNACKSATNDASALYAALRSENFDNLRNAQLPALGDTLRSLLTQLGALPTASGDVDVDAVGAQLQDEMQRMDNAIRHAVDRIKEIQKRAHEKNSGTRLAVNEKILAHCDALMLAVHELVSRSRDLQQEIVDAGRGTASPNEFYKRNHQWTKGLLSAAQAVGVAALELMNSADKVVLNEGKFEYLIVSAQEIAASVAQLYVSSRVKADRESERLAKLGAASKGVNEATAAVVAAVKHGKQTLEEEELFDFSALSLHDAKRAEMESQVKALELETQLGRERVRLASLRKQHYHLASLVAKNSEDGAAAAQ